MARREIPKVEGTAVVLERGVAGGTSTIEHVAAGKPTAPAAPVVVDIPEPYDQPDATGELSTQERGHLAACEAALDVLRTAFWRAGKALAVINSARLYRESHATFEDYVTERWQMQRAQAYRLINAAAIAEPIALSPMGDKINERQVRELLPLADQHSDQAAAELYLTLAKETANLDGAKVTAGLVHKAVTAAATALPPGTPWDSAVVAEIVRTALGLDGEQSAAEDDGEQPSWFAAEGTRVAAVADKVAKRAKSHPDEAREFAAALIQHARRIEKAVGKPTR